MYLLPSKPEIETALLDIALPIYLLVYQNSLCAKYVPSMCVQVSGKIQINWFFAISFATSYGPGSVRTKFSRSLWSRIPMLENASKFIVLNRLHTVQLCVLVKLLWLSILLLNFMKADYLQELFYLQLEVFHILYYDFPAFQNSDSLCSLFQLWYKWRGPEIIWERGIICKLTRSEQLVPIMLLTWIVTSNTVL